jgi:hypothetical protein
VMAIEMLLRELASCLVAHGVYNHGLIGIHPYGDVIVHTTYGAIAELVWGVN